MEVVQAAHVTTTVIPGSSWCHRARVFPPSFLLLHSFRFCSPLFSLVLLWVERMTFAHEEKPCG